ncbi:MAG: twin-arginine translocase TatA/TatE family subunit [Acidimicrobiales bacterium]
MTPQSLEQSLMGIGAPELLIVLAVVMLLFGAKKVPDLARSLGQAQREFKHGTSESKKYDDEAEAEKLKADAVKEAL